MTTLKLIYPALAQILWTFIVLAIMGYRRKQAFAKGEVALGDVAVSGERYPQPARLAAANFSNQFETPLLFFALVLIATQVGATGYAMAVLAWLFVASRVIHTLIHVGSNRLQHRAIIYMVGIAALFMMWIGIVVSLL